MPLITGSVFLAGALLSFALPVGLLLSFATFWYRQGRRFPENASTASTAAGATAVSATVSATTAAGTAAPAASDPADPSEAPVDPSRLYSDL